MILSFLIFFVSLKLPLRLQSQYYYRVLSNTRYLTYYLPKYLITFSKIFSDNSGEKNVGIFWKNLLSQQIYALQALQVRCNHYPSRSALLQCTGEVKGTKMLLQVINQRFYTTVLKEKRHNYSINKQTFMNFDSTHYKPFFTAL